MASRQRASAFVLRRNARLSGGPDQDGEICRSPSAHSWECPKQSGRFAQVLACAVDDSHACPIRSI
ncbi:hypothetical protein [Lysobacter gummosus]|uniref:hypothetical protein n=1 Tax=Lysobacter gummosus TaxID=262324 RepID=UPI00362BEEB0